MAIRIDPLVLQARGYDSTVDLNKPLSQMTEPYRMVGTIAVDGDSAYLTAFNGRWTVQDRRELSAQLKQYGLKQAFFRRGARATKKVDLNR